MSVAQDIADAVVGLLNDAPADTFNQRFAARRRFIPTLTLAKDETQPPSRDDLSEMRVEVIVPAVATMERADRATWESIYPVPMAATIKLTPGKDEAARDEEMELHVQFIQQVVDYLRANAQTTLATGAVLTRIEPREVFRSEALAASGQFFAMATLYYALLN